MVNKRSVKISLVLLSVVLFLSACNLPALSGNGKTPGTPTQSVLPLKTPTVQLPTIAPKTPTMPVSTVPAGPVDPFAKMTNFVDNSNGAVPEQAPATGNLVCGKKYIIAYPGIENWTSATGNPGVWFYVGFRYGFADSSPEMNQPGYFSADYLNWVGKKGAYSPGFDGRTYVSGNPVTFPFYLKCK